MDIKIYTMTHRAFTPPQDSVYVPMQVGRAVSEDLGFLGDDTGDNISDLNEFYGELTGIYWIWKNETEADIIGICHYRRYFLNEDGMIMSASDYQRILEEYDLMISDLPSSGGTNRENYARAHSIAELNAVADAIQMLYPDDYAAFEEVMEDDKCCYGNLMVCKKELFDEYCAWLFPVFLEIGDKIDVSSYDMYHKRLFGFLSEVLLYVWVRARKLNAYACRIGITAEKAETVEFKQAITALMQSGDIDQAKELFYGYLKLRPDIREQISDIRGEIPVLEQLLFIMHEERKAGVSGLLDFTNQMPVLTEHYKNICKLVREHGKNAREAGKDYFLEFPVSDVALSIVEKQLAGTLSYYDYLNEGMPPKKVSVIVPVYNASEQFSGCIGNLVHQTLEDIEIIFVDDCSTDNSLSILLECQRQYPQKVRVIASPENRRAGGARNLGLDLATGEYIGFVDADDLPDVQMYEKLYAKAKEGDYDMVDGGFVFDKKESLTLYTTDTETGELNNAKRSRLIRIGGYLWSKIVRRSLIEEQHLRFREHVPMLEDADFLDVLFATADSIGNLKEIIYRYKNTEDSLSKNMDRKAYWTSLYTAMEAIYERTHTLKNFKQIRKALDYENIQWYSSAVNSCVESYLKEEGYPIIEILEKFRQLKKKTVRLPYTDKIVTSVIELSDRSIMQMNDDNPRKLLKAAEEIGFDFNAE